MTPVIKRRKQPFNNDATKVSNADKVPFRCSSNKVCFHVVLGAAPKISIMHIT